VVPIVSVIASSGVAWCIDAVIGLRPPSARVEIRRTGNEAPSRAMDNLFWLARYAERTEGLIRLLRAVVVRLAGDTISTAAMHATELAERLLLPLEHVSDEAVAEAAVVGRPDDLKGQAISAFVTLEQGNQPSNELKEELKKWVTKEIGALARPDDIRFSDMLPKTRSGKIMRRLLRELATNGSVKGDTTTLEDFNVIAKLQEDE